MFQHFTSYHYLQKKLKFLQIWLKIYTTIICFQITKQKICKTKINDGKEKTFNYGVKNQEKEIGTDI